MTGPAVPAPQAPLTRRQIREAERAAAARAAEAAAREAERAAAREAEAESRTVSREAERPTAPVRSRRELRAARPGAVVAESAGQPAPTSPVPAAPSRRDLRAPAPAAPPGRESVTPDGPPPAPSGLPVAMPSRRDLRQQTAAPETTTLVRPAPVAVAVLPVPAPAVEPAEPVTAPAVPAPGARSADDTPTWAIALPAVPEVGPAPAGTPHRALRTAPCSGRPPRGPRTARRTSGWLPRAAVLSAMGALTIAAPLTGFTAPTETAAADVALPGTSALAQLDAAAALASGAALGPAPAALLADPTAAGRAELLQTSRAAERDALRCAPVSGASGMRAAVAEEAATLVMPLAAGTYRLTSRYGFRSHPISGVFGEHTGSDFSAPVGTAIFAVADGTVEYVGAGKDGRSGTLVVVRHDLDGAAVYSWYGHMYASGVHVVAGQEVSAGQHIADVGNSGNSTGPHLHLEIHTDDRLTTTDPLAWLAARGAQDPTAAC